jgi:ATP-dependent helicase/nuclease subunit B
VAERPGPQIYSIAAHRGFADALVAGLAPRYAEPDFGLAWLTLLLPSQRAARTVTEAFVRAFGDEGGKGMLLPRMAVVGDLDLDETLGPLLDPLGAGADIPPAADPTRRWFRLAEFLRAVKGDDAPKGAALLRQAFALGGTMDRLLIEGIGPGDLMSEEVVGIVGDQANHWRDATRDFLMVQAHWQAELEARGEVDAPTRRNMLFDHAASTWRASPPKHPVVAAGVTSASPALAALLRVVSELPRGAVILPDLDLSLDAEVWDDLGIAGVPEEPSGPHFGREDAVTHPQYHLKLLLNRMGVARDEVQPWHRSGIGAAPPARSRAISSLFLPPKASARWAGLPADQRRLAGVRLMECTHPGEEAQAIAILIREALTIPERRVAFITPDRGLAARVVAHLRRWHIEADDTAGQPLPQTAAGRVLLLLAEVMAEQAAPVPLLALLGHPLVRQGERRAEWLERVRALDLQLRGPRPDAGIGAIRNAAEKVATRQENLRMRDWWAEVEAILVQLLPAVEELPLAEALDLMALAAEALCGEAVWGGADGRSLSAFVEELREAAHETGIAIPLRDLPATLRDAMERVAVRPPWGGHPRVSIYGLLEARMARADLVICGALHEGSGPASPAPDPLLAPAVLRALGVPGADFRIGLAAHDLAAALGAPEVVLSFSHRDEAGPVIPSRFVLRVQALLGELADGHREREAVRLARLIDDAERAPVYPQPKPDPSPEQRDVPISVTALDRLRGDPYQFYAQAILRLRSLDPIDAEPTAAWKGTAVHAILDQWHKQREQPGQLLEVARAELDKMSAHPLMRSLWRPRLLAALEWVDEEIVRLKAEGRTVLATEAKGDITYHGVKLHGRADRIDKLPNGSLAVVDYKTGGPPTARMVEEGFALQLGLIGLMAREGAFNDVSGDPDRFEYWSLGKDKKRDNGFGYVEEPVRDPGSKRQTGPMRDEFLAETERYLIDAIDRWIKGTDPFVARLNPDLGGYNDYDQLMRLDEWQGREDKA